MYEYFTVAYDPELKSWFADIEVRAASSFLAWTRLGLVRFQPDSIEGCYISPVVLTSFCQLLPDRVLTIVKNPSRPQIWIAVAGIGERDWATPRIAGALMSDALVRVHRRIRKSDIGPSSVITVDDEGRPWVEHQVVSLPWRGNEQGFGAYNGEIWIDDQAAEYMLSIEERLRRADDQSISVKSRLIFADSVRL